jgi:hypothetical protein
MFVSFLAVAFIGFALLVVGTECLEMMNKRWEGGKIDGATDPT